MIDNAYFMDTSIPDLKYNDRKMIMDLFIKLSTSEYINIEVNAKKGKGILIKNTNYMYRFILSNQLSGQELKSIKLTQINLDLYSEKFMGGILNKYESKNNLNNKKLPEIPDVVHVGLDKVYENPYNEDVSDWTMRFMKMLTSRSIKYTNELSGNYEDLKEVANLMREYSEDTSNLIYYDEDEMNESIRKTDLKYAKEEGINEGFDSGFDNGFDNGEISGILKGKIETSFEIVKEMLKRKMPINIISEITKITKEEILKLQDQDKIIKF